MEFGNLIRNLTELREGHFSLKEEDRTLCGVLGEQPGAAGDEAAVPAAGNEGRVVCSSRRRGRRGKDSGRFPAEEWKELS